MNRIRWAARTLILLIGALALLGDSCTLATSPRSRGRDVVLHVGETVTLKSPSVTVMFDRVDGDSRCPINAECFAAGEARVTLTARTTFLGERFSLSMMGEENLVDATRSVRVLGHRFQMLRLDPYPGTQINPPDPQSQVLTLHID